MYHKNDYEEYRDFSILPYTYQVLTMGYGWVSKKSGYVPAVKEGL